MIFKIKNTENKCDGENLKKLEVLYTDNINAQWCSCCGQQLEFLRKLNIELLHHPIIPLLDIYTIKWKSMSTKIFVYAYSEQNQL